MLHDVSKDHSHRKLPKPNVTNVQLERQSHNTISTTYRVEEDTAQPRIAFKNGIILFYDDHGRIIRVDGFIPDLVDYPVTIIAKYGYDIYTDILGLTPPEV